LWDDSLRALGQDADALPRVVSWATKRYVASGDNVPRTSVAPVVYLLDPQRAPTETEITMLAPVEAGLALLANLALGGCITNDLRTAATDAVFEFSSTATVQRLTYERRFECLDDLVARIVANVEQLGDDAH
jgi:hypothetical protein